eukprot:SAG31_NODE_3638_length_4034_cov_4.484371_4_plen_191_part_00
MQHWRWVDHHRRRNARGRWPLPLGPTMRAISYLEPGEIVALGQCSRILRSWLSDRQVVTAVLASMKQHAVAQLRLLQQAPATILTTGTVATANSSWSTADSHVDEEGSRADNRHRLKGRAQARALLQATCKEVEKLRLPAALASVATFSTPPADLELAAEAYWLMAEPYARPAGQTGLCLQHNVMCRARC